MYTLDACTSHVLKAYLLLTKWTRYWWKHASQRPGKHSTRPRASYSPLPPPSGQLYADTSKTGIDHHCARAPRPPGVLSQQPGSDRRLDLPTCAAGRAGGRPGPARFPPSP